MISLKVFHFIFIVLSTILSAWLGIWGILDYQASGKGPHLILGLIGFLSVIILILYFFRISAKLKKLHA